VRPKCHHLAGNLVPHRERQAHTARFERDLLSVAEIEMPVPDMHVAVADPRGLDTQQNLLSHRLGIRVLPGFERLAPFDDLNRTHTGVLRISTRSALLAGSLSLERRP
jgi:hypothetical protein